MEPWMEEQKCPGSPFTVLSSPQQCPLPNLALLVYICRLIKPKPSSTMFSKHSLITINQQAGGAAACPVSILLMTEEECQTASSALGGEIWVLPRLRRQRRCWELSSTECRSLVLDKEKWAGPLSEKNNVKSPSTYPSPFFLPDEPGDQNQGGGKARGKGRPASHPYIRDLCISLKPETRAGWRQQQQEELKLDNQKYFPIWRIAKAILGQVTKERNVIYDL